MLHLTIIYGKLASFKCFKMPFPSCFKISYVGNIKITPYITHKVITCLSVFSFEREKYSTKVLTSVIERLTSSNTLIYE